MRRDTRTYALLANPQDPISRVLWAGINANDLRASMCLSDFDLVNKYYLLALQYPDAIGHAEALQAHAGFVEERVGFPPLADGGKDWPDGLNEPGYLHGQVWDIPQSAPLTGWRVWDVQDGRLVAPFVSKRWDHDPAATGATWLPGVNRNDETRCQEVEETRHPWAGCRCGLRAMQSLTVLHAYVDEQVQAGVRGIGAPLVPSAVAEVAFWGRVTAGAAPPWDWPWTARAEKAELVGPIYLSPEVEGQGPAIEETYRTPTSDGPLSGWSWWDEEVSR